MRTISHPETTARVERLEPRHHLAGDFGSVVTAGGTGKDRGNSVAADLQGNAIVAGVYSGAIDVDPTPAVRRLPHVNGDETFVAKYAPGGALLWAVALTGVGRQEIQSVAVDRAGNVYCGGYFENTVDFDPGTGRKSVTSLGRADAFVLKLNSAGAFQWVRRTGGAGDEGVVAIAADADGNVAAMGMFNGTADFDPNAGVRSYATAGGFDLFVTKLSATGDTVYAHRIGGTGEEFGNAITFDPAGNAIASGSFSRTVDFNPSPVATANQTSAGASDVFVVKLAPYGTYLASRRFGGAGNDQGGDVRADAWGNVVLTGQFFGTVDFNPSASVVANLTASGSTGDAFVAKLDRNFAYQWARRLGGNGNDRGTDLGIDATGAVYVTGVFSGTADFDPSTGGTYNLTSASYSSDVFVAKLTAAGGFTWARRVGGAAANDIGEGLALAGSWVYVTGAFGASVDFDPGTGTASRTSAGGDDLFLLELINR